MELYGIDWDSMGFDGDLMGFTVMGFNSPSA
jgi:hypothetical protein